MPPEFQTPTSPPARRHVVSIATPDADRFLDTTAPRRFSEDAASHCLPLFDDIVTLFITDTTPAHVLTLSLYTEGVDVELYRHYYAARSPRIMLISNNCCHGYSNISIWMIRSTDRIAPNRMNTILSRHQVERRHSTRKAQGGEVRAGIVQNRQKKTDPFHAHASSPTAPVAIRCCRAMPGAGASMAYTYRPCRHIIIASCPRYVVLHGSTMPRAETSSARDEMAGNSCPGRQGQA